MMACLRPILSRGSEVRCAVPPVLKLPGGMLLRAVPPDSSKVWIVVNHSFELFSTFRMERNS